MTDQSHAAYRPDVTGPDSGEAQGEAAASRSCQGSLDGTVPSPGPATSSAASLRERVIARAEYWERDAEEAQVAASSHKGVDDEAAVDLFRAAARSRSRALELRSLLEAENA